jgi:hypothetical protein
VLVLPEKKRELRRNLGLKGRKEQEAGEIFVIFYILGA